MQTYKDSRDKSAQKKMQYSLLNKTGFINGLLMPFANVRKRFCYHERHYVPSRRIFLDGDEPNWNQWSLKTLLICGSWYFDHFNVAISKYRNTVWYKLIRVFLRIYENDQGKMFLHSKSRKSFRIRLKKKTRKPLPDDQLAEILKRRAIQS
jgi:hypothetical protein